MNTELLAEIGNKVVISHESEEEDEGEADGGDSSEEVSSEQDGS